MKGGDRVLEQTPSAKKADIDPIWYVADAEGQVLGRFASRVATILRGKHKPFYTPHVDGGDHVIVINADKIQVKGNNKLDQKVYTSYSGYPGGLKTITLGRALQEKPEFVVGNAIKGMLPRTKLGRKMLKKVRIYTGSEHPHQAQSPQPLEL